MAQRPVNNSVDPLSPRLPKSNHKELQKSQRWALDVTGGAPVALEDGRDDEADVGGDKRDPHRGKRSFAPTQDVDGVGEDSPNL